MQCPICELPTGEHANFCPHCGYQLPIIVGSSFQFGIRFPEAKNMSFQAAVNNAQRAPRYSFSDGYHIALFERHNIHQLAELYCLATKAFVRPRDRLIEHTTDGGDTFFTGPSFWNCLSDRLNNEVSYNVHNHPCRCLSYFGCYQAQQRQPDMWHIQGGETFFHREHGFFPGREGDYERLEEIRELLGRADYDRVMDTGIFHMDKPKILQGVLTLIKRFGGNRCPLFSMMHLNTQIAKLPEVVRLEREPMWRFVSDPTRGPGVIFGCYRFAATEAEKVGGRVLAIEG